MYIDSLCVSIQIICVFSCMLPNIVSEHLLQTCKFYNGLENIINRQKFADSQNAIYDGMTENIQQLLHYISK